MKGLFKKLENIYAAAAFAEAGEFKTAREILREEVPLTKKIKELKHEVALTIDELISMAIAFAEVGEHKKALDILKEAEERLEEVKLVHQKELERVIPTPKMSTI